MRAPSLLSRLVDRFRPAPRIVREPVFLPGMEAIQASMQNFESSRYTADRSWLPGYAQDARADYTSWARIELCRRARYMERNNAIAQKILDLIETNVVGTGINPTPASSSDKFNRAALEWWNGWCQFADLTSRQHLYSLQAMLVRAWMLDGDVFVWLTKGDSGRPRLRIIESHRVVSANLKNFSREGYIDADGVLLDQNGRPAFFVVTNDNDAYSGKQAREVVPIPADEVVQVFEPSRQGQTRGITIFHSCLHTLHDLDDLQKYELLAAKDAAEISKVITTASGDIDTNGSSGGVIGRSYNQTKSDGSQVARQAFYEAKLGGRTVSLFRGDQLAQFQSNRPSPATKELWDYLTNLVCKGVGVSFAAVQDYAGNWGGAALRGAIAADNRFYDVRANTFSSAMQRIYEYAIGWAIANGEIVDPKSGKEVKVPADWKKARWQGPRRMTADVGRESQALLAELDKGIRTERDILGELGLDYNAVRAQRVSEVRARLDEAKSISEDYDLPLTTAYTLLAEMPKTAGNMKPSGGGSDAADPADAPAKTAVNDQ